ncbi:hypothetical protein BAUCODRAFT_34594 [Baudoinia panamericana UAMH 10762]|uniref:Uncharacterized protein n=1 Tax=Baudoinia panamericana (strain UAMH 10762) TaxID=717646 RepID=M2LN98_BAUPA|nr:uncharacterized protein BAUCODRAFT_34594 [Baudoinia panamericana UAMH 10762]EMC95827.1 hypothetical protein BAUCODRAFT_34594 [Baudoinia panamericana UAMH 10762]
MEAPLRVEESVRLSESPRRSPQITQAVRSPAISVHPEMQGIDSSHNRTDPGLRTTDFFDDTSDEETTSNARSAGGGPNVRSAEAIEPRSSAMKKRQRISTGSDLVSQCEPKHVSLPPEGRYHPLAASHGHEEQAELPDTPSTSFNGSVDELLPIPSNDQISPPQFPRQARVASGRTPRSSALIEQCQGDPLAPSPSKVEQILGAHAIAHEITLNALMREEKLNASVEGFAPLKLTNRASLLPASLRLHDPRSPRTQTFATPQSAASSSKRVQVVPPPIDTSGPRGSLPQELVRTPYPYSPESVHRKNIGQMSPPSAVVSTFGASESILTLSIRRRNQNSLPRVATLVISGSNDFSTLSSRSTWQKDKHFRTIEYDDAEFFRQLQSAYRQLSGPLRVFSARSLTRIAVSGPASRAADAGYGWLHQPRSPRTLAYRGLSDTFSEEKILQHYRKPALGRARYAFVHWAHRIAAAPPMPVPGGSAKIALETERDLVHRAWQPEGLEFVVSWSIARVFAALLLVLMASITAAVLWVFLGRVTTPGATPHGGFRDAGDRVVSGVLLGICLLLLGLSGIAGWLGVSWLVS